MVEVNQKVDSRHAYWNVQFVIFREELLNPFTTDLVKALHFAILV